MSSKNNAINLVAAIFTKNEAPNIKNCIESLKGIENIVLVDSSSTDESQQIGEMLGANVLNFNWNGRYPRKKQWTLNQLSSYDWILMMDADLRASQSLIEEIHELIKDDQLSAILIPIEYWFKGKRLRFGVKVKYLGVLRREAVEFPNVEPDFEGYGDIEFHYQPIVKGKIIKSKNSIIHNDIDSISSWVERHNKYAVYQAKINRSSKFKNLIDKNKTFQGKLFSKVPFKSISFFVYSYFLCGGFLDGRIGFQYNYLLAHHYYLQKIYELE